MTRSIIMIREVVQQAFKVGYLTVEAENQLRQLLAKRYDLEDLDAFMALQQAVTCGCLRKEAGIPQETCNDLS